MAYETKKIAEGLLVLDVPLMLPMLKGEHDVRINIDEKWFGDAIRLFDERKRLGKFARYKAGHATEAPVIGHLTSLQFKAPWLYTTILITEPDAIAKFERGEMPSLSAEFVDSQEWPLIWGAASTAGDVAHFEEKPDMMPKELSDRLKSLGAGLIRCAAPKPEEKKSASAPSAPAQSDPYGAPANQTPTGEAKPEEDVDSEDEKVRMKKELTEALQRIGDLEKGLKQAQDAAHAAQAKPPVLEDAADKEEMPMSDAEGKEMPMGDKPVAGEKPAEESKPAKPFEKKLAADEVLETGESYSVVKREEKFCVLLKGELKKSFAEQADAVDLFNAFEVNARQTKLMGALKTLKDSGCPLKVEAILTKLTAAKTPEAFESELTALKFVPKWQDLASGDGAKVDKSGKALPASEQVKLFISDCESKGMTRAHAIVKLSKEQKELYKAWTGSEPR